MQESCTNNNNQLNTKRKENKRIKYVSMVSDLTDDIRDGVPTAKSLASLAVESERHLDMGQTLLVWVIFWVLRQLL